MVTMMWGVRRGLFSNEAGQGSAPIAHAAAKTDEPVSEGVVALLEPFIDTIVICTLTALVIITTGVWQDRVPTAITLVGGDLSYVAPNDHDGVSPVEVPTSPFAYVDGVASDTSGLAQIAWHEVPVGQLFIDDALSALHRLDRSDTGRGDDGER